MATGYNLRHLLDKGAGAGLQFIKSPAPGGEIALRDQDQSACVLGENGAYTLQPAAKTPVGTEVTIHVVDGAFVTVDGDSVGYGYPTKYTVALSSTREHVWVRNPVGPAYAGTYEFLNTATAQDTVDGLLAILGFLQNQGLIDASGITQA